MRTPLRSFFIPAALVVGVALAGAAYADTAGTDSNPPPSEHAHHGHRHWMPAFARALHQVNLTDAQKTQLHDLFKADHATMHDQFKSLRDQHQAFDRAIPGTADFQMAQASLAQAETAAIQAHVQHEADLHTKIYALLTDDQKTQLATALANIQAKDDARHDGMPPPKD